MIVFNRKFKGLVEKVEGLWGRLSGVGDVLKSGGES